jgi:alkylation response protein AidB-like acyl-CoA dehydrogenase
MHWELSDEQSLYADSLRDWLAASAPAAQVRSWLDNGDGRSFDDALIAEGWSAVGVDETVGGQGGGLLELALAARELSRMAAPSGRWMARAISDVALCTEPALRKAMVESGELTAVAVRADRIPAVATDLRYSGGHLHGRVPCVLGAAAAHRFLVPVQIPGVGLGLVVVDGAGPTVHIHPRDVLDRSRDVAGVVFDDAPARLIESDAAAAMTAIGNRAAVLTAADAVGCAERMLDMSVDYAKQRKQFGQPIGAFQAVKHALAEMLVTVEASYSVAIFAAASVQQDQPDCALHAAAAKAQASAGCAELADSALTLHGAIGYTWEYDLQLFYKRAKLNHVLFGTPTAWNERIAAALPLVARKA